MDPDEAMVLEAAQQRLVERVVESLHGEASSRDDHRGTFAGVAAVLLARAALTPDERFAPRPPASIHEALATRRVDVPVGLFTADPAERDVLRMRILARIVGSLLAMDEHAHAKACLVGLG